MPTTSLLHDTKSIGTQSLPWQGGVDSEWLESLPCQSGIVSEWLNSLCDRCRQPLLVCGCSSQRWRDLNVCLHLQRRVDSKSAIRLFAFCNSTSKEWSRDSISGPGDAFACVLAKASLAWMNLVIAVILRWATFFGWVRHWAQEDFASFSHILVVVSACSCSELLFLNKVVLFHFNIIKSIAK